MIKSLVRQPMAPNPVLYSPTQCGKSLLILFHLGKRQRLKYATFCYWQVGISDSSF